MKEIFEEKKSTRMGFEPTRGDPNGLAVHRLNHSATSSTWPRKAKTPGHFTGVTNSRQWLNIKARSLLFLLHFDPADSTIAHTYAAQSVASI